MPDQRRRYRQWWERSSPCEGTHGSGPSLFRHRCSVTAFSSMLRSVFRVGLGRLPTVPLHYTLFSFVVLVAFASSASAQFGEATLTLNPDAGGPTEVFTATYDVTNGRCAYADGRMVNFYWYGGSSSITVLGKAPMTRCVASLSTVPPAGTSPGEYTVTADVFSPAGPQAEEGGRYRVLASPRGTSPRSPTSSTTSPGSSGAPTGSSSATTTIAGSTTGGGQLGPPDQLSPAGQKSQREPTGSAPPKSGPLPGAPSPASPASPESSDGRVSPETASAPTSADCTTDDSDCGSQTSAVEHPEREGRAKLVVLAAAALLAFAAWAVQRKLRR